jgi:acyl dehydratase
VINRSFVGRSYPPSEPYAVTRVKIREFADALGDENPVFRDVAAARALGHPDLVAPPTFPIVLTMGVAEQAVRDPDLGVDYSRVVHGQQRFTYDRPLFAGDEVVATMRVAEITALGRNEVLATEVAVATTAGEPVCTAYSTLVVRGGAP